MSAPAPAPTSRRPTLASAEPLQQLLPRLRPHAGTIGVVTFAILLGGGAGLAFPLLVRRMLDAAFEAHDGAGLDRIALLLVVMFALQGIMNYVQVRLLHSTAERVVARLREDLFAHLVRLSPGFFTERRTGELTSRLTADLTILQTLVAQQVGEYARQLILLVGGVIFLTLTHPRLTATVLAVSPVVVATAIVFGRRLRRASTGVQDRVAAAMGSADEALSHIRTVQGFNRESLETRRFGGLLDGVVEAAIARAKIRATFFGVVGFVAFAGIVAVIWQGGRLVLEGVLTPGALVSFLLYSVTVAAAVGAMASMFGVYQEALGAARRVFELLATEPTVAEPASPATLSLPARGALALEHVGFRYSAEGAEILHDVSLSLQPGEVVALVGPSGAGKTTVASLIPRFWDVTSGCITFDGVDVRSLSFADLRGHIGIVPQEPALFSGSIRENIAYARDGASDDEIEAAARAAHAHEFITRLADGYATRVGERGVKLSGGQRQRIALARVFLRNPALVILDEATSALDTESERLVEEAMDTLLRGRTTLIIAHRLSTVQRAHRVIVMEHGRVIEEGTHEALLARGGMYARLFG